MKPAGRDLRIDRKICGKGLMLGVTSFLSQISLVAAMAATNNMLRKYGALDEIFGQAQYAQIPMAVVGIVMKFFQIVISVVVGMAAGCIPIVGFNMGADKPGRVQSCSPGCCWPRRWWASSPWYWPRGSPGSSSPCSVPTTKATITPTLLSAPSGSI